MKTIADLLNSDEPIPVNAHDNPWAIRNPRDEARDLHRMVRSGSSSIEEIRELIAVPKPVEEALLAYAERFPTDGQRIYCVLQFREKVAVEFERLIESDADSLVASPADAIADDELTTEPLPPTDFFVN
ncbi:MAG TPA: hypothetical protein VFB23_03380 [Candidatus Acidoferrales bacterium]|nr:hypothetical protein [Candidatus Acidoferrales bacterium]